MCTTRLKPVAASSKQLSYLYKLAESQGMDAEALSRLEYNKDLIDLTADEASTLIKKLQ